MTDTPDFIRKKQIEIFLAKPESVRWQLGLGMIDEVWHSVKNSIHIEKPHLSQAELRVELFKRYYKNDFSALELDIIAQKLLLWHRKAES
jgi:hypothetical protein